MFIASVNIHGWLLVTEEGGDRNLEGETPSKVEQMKTFMVHRTVTSSFRVLSHWLAHINIWSGVSKGLRGRRSHETKRKSSGGQ